MAFPTTETELKNQGYVYDNTAKCRGCGSEINWYRTPKGKMIPLDPELTPHWSTCPKADQFRREK